MPIIPSMRELVGSFRQDVRLMSWREPAKPSGRPVVFTGPQKELFDHLMRIAAEAETRREKVIEGLATRRDILRRSAEAREVLRGVQGLAKLPRRTPLRARVRRGVVRETYRIEHVILQSRPGYYVTANLYLPTAGRPPWPVVLGVAGHSANGKTLYQGEAMALAACGVACLAPDPPGQGERDEYVDLATGKRTVGRACRMHAVAGDPCYLLGSNFGEYRLWDCMRCIDYLETRDDIDASKLGTWGSSGGGWESLWLAAVDERVKVLNSNCYLTTFRRRMEERWRDAESDPEQDPFGLLSAGMDAADLILACFPRPVSFGVAIFDFFPVDGALECYAEAKRLYRLGGVPERIGIAVGDSGHGRTPEVKRFTTRWLVRWLTGRELDPWDERLLPPSHRDTEEETWCTKTGIVLTSLGGKTTAQINGERARELALGRKHPKTAAGFLKRARRIRSEIERLLRYQPIATPLQVTYAEPTVLHGASATPLEILSDGSLRLAARLWTPTGEGRRPAAILLAEKTGDYDPLGNSLARRLVKAGAVVLDLDPRGMGPVEEVWNHHVPLLESNLTYDGFLLGRPVLGMHVADVIRAVGFLARRRDVDAAQIAVVGDGYGALLGLLAACLEPMVRRVVELRALTSYASLTWHRDYDWPVSVILPGVLEHFDLEDVRAAIAPRGLLCVEPLDHLKRPLSSARARREYDSVRRAFTALGSPRAFRLACGQPKSEHTLITPFLTDSAQ